MGAEKKRKQLKSHGGCFLSNAHILKGGEAPGVTGDLATPELLDLMKPYSTLSYLFFFFKEQSDICTQC